MLICAAMLLAANAPVDLDKYNVRWDSPSVDAAGSMPIGNGEVVLNAWVERATGDILFYIARTDAMSEISRVLKLGRVRVHLDPNPFRDADDFRQELKLREGTIEFQGNGETVRLFVDSGSNVVHLASNFKSAHSVVATMESWRNEARELPKAEGASAWSVHDAPFPLVESADVFVPDPAGVTWYHRNETSVVPKLWENQSLTGLKGTFDPLLHRTFGGRLAGRDLVPVDRSIGSRDPIQNLDLTVATASAQTDFAEDWEMLVFAESQKSLLKDAEDRTKKWWGDFWDRSWVFVSGDRESEAVPVNDFPLRQGKDSNGQNIFPGTIENPAFYRRPLTADEVVKRPGSDEGISYDFSQGFTLLATITPTDGRPGRIFDKLTAGQDDGFLFDTHPGDSLRLIIGGMVLTAPHVVALRKAQNVAATYDPATGHAVIYLDGKVVAERLPEPGSAVTRGYVLQRYVQACQGRGTYPIKFNGGFYTVEPKAVGKPFNADWRSWGDSQWYQNLRHMYHPMLASGDIDMMAPFFKLYESVRPLAESRTKAYHGAEGAYFPETMTNFGTYSGGDYGWDRTGHSPKDVLCPWWQYAWNQGPELVSLMLDKWDYTQDRGFLKKELLPMAESVLKYFDTRFKKDASGRIVLDPTQVVETYWTGVVNDMPSTAGLISITERLTSLPISAVSASQKAFFAHMKSACPELPLHDVEGQRELSPAQKYDTDVSNVENGELYGVWPFRLITLNHPSLLAEAKRAYAHRKNHLDVGWGYDGNVAALLGMTDEAARILRVKVRNSHPAYRWPATWGPNFDWLPDQNHGGNLLNTTNLMLIQAEPLEQGGRILLLPAWPKEWDVDFKLHAPGNTVVHGAVRAGKVEYEVTPTSRRKDVVLGEGWGP